MCKMDWKRDETLVSEAFHENATRCLRMSEVGRLQVLSQQMVKLRKSVTVSASGFVGMCKEWQ